jgi:hypothetical protein
VRRHPGPNWGVYPGLTSFKGNVASFALLVTAFPLSGNDDAKKLGTVGEKIVTVWGVGYRFVA